MAIEITGLDAVQKKLRELEKKTDNMHPMMHAIGTLIKQKAQMSIRQSKDAIRGNPYPDLSPKYQKQKRKSKGGLQQILVDSGDLSRVIFRADKKSVTIGTNAHSESGFAYPVVHQFGSKKTPQRAFLPIEGDENSFRLTKDILDEIIEMIDDEIGKVVK